MGRAAYLGRLDQQPRPDVRVRRGGAAIGEKDERCRSFRALIRPGDGIILADAMGLADGRTRSQCSWVVPSPAPRTSATASGRRCPSDWLWALMLRETKSASLRQRLGVGLADLDVLREADVGLEVLQVAADRPVGDVDADQDRQQRLQRLLGDGLGQRLLDAARPSASRRCPCRRSGRRRWRWPRSRSRQAAGRSRSWR